MYYYIGPSVETMKLMAHVKDDDSNKNNDESKFVDTRLAHAYSSADIIIADVNEHQVY